MALKPKEANCKIEKLNPGFNETSFFEGVLKNEYILVVGSGVILDRSKFPACGGDILNFIEEALNQLRIEEFQEQMMKGKNISVSVTMKDLLTKRMDYDIDDIAPELRRLLEKRWFRYIFATTPDHYLETLLQGIWGNELRVVNFSDEISLQRFNRALTSVGVKNYSQPTLFYVFGKATESMDMKGKFLQDDNDAIMYIEKWLKLSEDDPTVEFLKLKRIFGVGCSFEDWYYRFFWYILTRDFTNRNAAPYKSDNAVLGDNVGNLEKYLTNLNVCVHNDSLSVISYINRRLDSRIGDTSFRDLIIQKRMEGKVFLSYKNMPDGEIAIKLFNRLTSAHSCSVWFDESSILGGQSFNRKIPEAIRFSQVFIPLLTDAVAKVLDRWSLGDLLNTGTEGGLPYFIQEWKWAGKVEGIKIIPVAWGGYDLRGSAHLKFEAIVYGDNRNDLPSGIYLGAGDELDNAAVDKLMVSIKHALGIYE